jgi:CDP-6-deoxy-D-xylo-4-hexulose-3-dehydrase
MIKLVKDTISNEEIDNLCSWLKTYPRLTKGEHTDLFEEKWGEYLGTKHNLFVTSGSSANLAAFYAMLLSGRLKNKKVILPAVSWSTTVAPAIQLGYEPVLCDCNLKNFGLDLEHLEQLVEEHDPGLIVTCNVLGFANDYDKITDICNKNNIYIIEDSCESIGTIYKGKMTGNFGHISTFSFYYGHHMSTIEGGMVCTNLKDVATILRSIRCHGWDRDLDLESQKILRQKNNIDQFKALYTFYYPGFNLRASDLQAFLGLQQIQRLQKMNEARQENFNFFNKNISTGWQLDLENYSFVSNMAFPVITEDIELVKQRLVEAKIEHRPLICGSIGKQPFWTDRYGECNLKNADVIHNLGIYIPNNPDLTTEEKDKMVDCFRGINK